jgi:hypothetical protein
MTDQSNISYSRQPFFTTFMWVWGVCFLFIYGFSAVVNMPKAALKTSLFYLVFISFIASIPIGFIVTGVLIFFRKRIMGSQAVQPLIKDKSFNIAIGIYMFSFFMALVGLHLTLYTDIDFGKPLGFCSALLGVLTIFIFWIVRLVTYRRNSRK